MSRPVTPNFRGHVALAAVEAALQRAVRLSSSAQHACNRLEGTVVALCCDDLGCTIVLQAGAHGVRLMLNEHAAAGLRLTGTVPAILATLHDSQKLPQARWRGQADAMNALRCLVQATARQGLGWPLALDGFVIHGMGQVVDGLRGTGRSLLRQMAEAATWEWGWCATPTQASVLEQRLDILDGQLQQLHASNAGVAGSV
jgi:ubiquinone biosynthesis protein UbiJ